MSNLAHLPTDVMFSGQQFAILAMFLWICCMIFFSGQVAWFFCVILCVERLRDFCVWRGCVIFLTNSLRLHGLFLWRLRDYCAERLRDFLVERLHDFLCEEVA